MTATLENQRSIMTAVAHDLRTPIASMRLRAEFVADEEERARLRETLDEMQTMTEAVLSAARSDRTGETARPVDLTALVESLADDMNETGGDVVFVSEGAVRCVCRTNEVRRAVRNLIDNALRYGARARVVWASSASSLWSASRMTGLGFRPATSSACSNRSCGWKDRAARRRAAMGLGFRSRAGSRAGTAATCSCATAAAVG